MPRASLSEPLVMGVLSNSGLSPEQQIKLAQGFEKEVQLLAGRPAAMEIAAEAMNYHRRPRCQAFEAAK